MKLFKERKINKYKFRRIILSLILPTVFGIVFYSWLTGLYSEPIFWLGIIFVFPKLYLFMLIPSSLYTLIMEYLGKKLLHNPNMANKLLLNSLLFIAAGTLIGGLIPINSSDDFYVIGLLTGFLVTLIKLRFHLLERKHVEILDDSFHLN